MRNFPIRAACCHSENKGSLSSVLCKWTYCIFAHIWVDSTRCEIVIIHNRSCIEFCRVPDIPPLGIANCHNLLRNAGKGLLNSAPSTLTHGFVECEVNLVGANNDPRCFNDSAIELLDRV